MISRPSPHWCTRKGCSFFNYLFFGGVFLLPLLRWFLCVIVCLFNHYSSVNPISNCQSIKQWSRAEEKITMNDTGQIDAQCTAFPASALNPRVVTLDPCWNVSECWLSNKNSLLRFILWIWSSYDFIMPLLLTQGCRVQWRISSCKVWVNLLA